MSPSARRPHHNTNPWGPPLRVRFCRSGWGLRVGISNTGVFSPSRGHTLKTTVPIGIPGYQPVDAAFPSPSGILKDWVLSRKPRRERPYELLSTSGPLPGALPLTDSPLAPGPADLCSPFPGLCRVQSRRQQGAWSFLGTFFLSFSKQMFIHTADPN